MGAENYTLGKGIIYFDRKNMSTGLYEGERDLGNAPAFSFNIAIEKLEHFSSRGGLKAKDKLVISQMTPSCSFTLDEINAENLALLSMADITTVTQTSGTATNEAHTAHVGMRFELTKREISAVTVTNVAGTTTYVNGTDYIIDTTLKDDEIGRIYIPVGSSITDGSVVHVDYSYAATTYKEVRAFKNTQVEGMLRFVSDNPAGKQMQVQIWRVSLTPAGDTSMIGDDWSTLGFTGEVLKDESGHPNSPYMSIIMD